MVSQPGPRFLFYLAGPRFWFYLTLTVLFAVVSVQYSVKVLTPKKDGHTSSAILRWAKQIQAMEEGENIHAKFNYPNPPILPQMLWPLAELAGISPLAAALVWFYLKVGMAILCLVWAFRLVETPGRPYPEWAKVLAVAASINPVIGDLKHGNVNILILLLVMAALYAFRHGKDFLSGLFVALAIACKVTPALFVVYFAWKRAWRVLVGTAVGLVLFFLVVPSLVFATQKGSLVEGWQHNWSALTAWKEGMIDPYLVRGEVTSERENQSLPGVLTRLLSREPSFSKWIDNADTPLAYHNVADLDRQTIKRIVQGCQLAFLVAMVLLCRAPVRGAADVRGGWRLAAEYSLVLVGMLLFSERTWKHHCVTLVLPFAVLAYGAFADGFSWRVRLVSRVTFFLAMVSVLLPTVLEAFKGLTLMDVGTVDPRAIELLDLNPNSPRELAQVYGAYLWGFAALLVGLGTMLASRRASVSLAH